MITKPILAISTAIYQIYKKYVEQLQRYNNVRYDKDSKEQQTEEVEKWKCKVFRP